MTFNSINQVPFDVTTEIPISLIKPSLTNPYKRTQPGPEMARLETEIKQYGCIYTPLQVSKDGTIIFGHRRRQAAINLGFITIPVIRRNMSSQDEIDRMYLSEYRSSKNTGGPEWAWKYYNGNTRFIPEHRIRQCAVIKRLMGRIFLKEMYEKNISPTIIEIAYQIGSYSGKFAKDNYSVLKETLVWLTPAIRRDDVRMWIKQGKSGEMILKCIKNNKDLPNMRKSIKEKSKLFNFWHSLKGHTTLDDFLNKNNGLTNYDKLHIAVEKITKFSPSKGSLYHAIRIRKKELKESKV